MEVIGDAIDGGKACVEDGDALGIVAVIVAAANGEAAIGLGGADQLENADERGIPASPLQSSRIVDGAAELRRSEGTCSSSGALTREALCDGDANCTSSVFIASSASCPMILVRSISAILQTARGWVTSGVDDHRGCREPTKVMV
jgi:hypothetical protein